MFDINEIEGKVLMSRLANGSLILDKVETGKIIYGVNKKNDERYKIVFNKVNGSSYKAVLSYDNDKKDRETKILMNGKISILFCGSVISLYFREGKLHIVAPQQIEFYE